MRKVVEKTGRTYEEAVESALADLGIPREQAEVVLLHARDIDRRNPGPEEYRVRAWDRGTTEPRSQSSAPAPMDIPPAQPVVCEKTAPTFDEALKACLDVLDISEEEADIQVLQREDTNPLKPGPEKVTVRVWRRHITEPAPKPGAAGAEDIHSIHAAAHLPTDDELSFEEPAEPGRNPGSMEETQ